MLKKRVLGLLVSGAIIAMLFIPLCVSAANVQTESGVLFWDFEDSCQVAPPPLQWIWSDAESKMVGGECYWEAYPNDTDGINSGSWTNLDPKVAVGKGSMPMVQVATTEIYGKPEGQAGWDSPESYYPTRTNPNKLKDAGKIKKFFDAEIEDKGNYCLGAFTKDGGHARVLGSCIKLKDTELIPGQRYKLECSVYVSYPNADGGNNSLNLYTGFGVPSARKTSRVYRHWEKPELNVPYCFDGHPVEQNPTSPDNARLLWQGLPDEKWLDCGEDFFFTAPDAAYENHETILYIGVANFSEGLGYYVSGGTKLFLDNIKITPVDAAGKPVLEVSYNSLGIGGKYWEFEEETDVSEWVAIKESDANRKVASATVAEINTALQTKGIYGQIGNPAAGSMKCVGINKRNDDKMGGIKVYLKKEDFPAGNYTLRFRVAHPGDKGTAERLYAAVYPGKWIPDGYNSKNAAAFANESSSHEQLPNLGPWWTDVSCNIKIKDSDFVDGYATLALLTERIWGVWVDAGTEGSVYFDSDVRTYYDDICITMNSKEELPTGAFHLISELACYGLNTKDVLITNVLYDSAGDNPDKSLSLSARVVGGVTGIKKALIPVEIDNSIDLPFMKIFTWDRNTLEPLRDIDGLGFSFDE